MVVDAACQEPRPTPLPQVARPRAAPARRRGRKLVDDGRSVGLRRDIGGHQALGLDAERGVDAEGGSRAAVQMVKVSLGRFLAG